MKIVKKHWGKEYPIYSNPHVEIKHLTINQGECTSLHCHPKKKTGLCVLKGVVRLDFLNNSIWLEPGDKVMIRQGVFHRSNAILDSELLEIENPVDKNDLVRLEDKYGREQGYETQYIEENVFIFNNDTINTQKQLGDVLVKHESLSQVNPGKYMILWGGVYNIFQNQKVYVLGPGDLVDHNTIDKMINKFTSEPIEVLYIKRI